MRRGREERGEKAYLAEDPESQGSDAHSGVFEEGGAGEVEGEEDEVP